MHSLCFSDTTVYVSLHLVPGCYVSRVWYTFVGKHSHRCFRDLSVIVVVRRRISFLHLPSQQLFIISYLHCQFAHRGRNILEGDDEESDFEKSVLSVWIGTSVSQQSNDRMFPRDANFHRAKVS